MTCPLQDSGLRRGKIMAASDQFAQLVAGAVDALIAQSVSSKAASKQGSQTVIQPAVRQIPLPASIIANHEPFRQGDWHKEPYPARYAHKLSVMHTTYNDASCVTWLARHHLVHWQEPITQALPSQVGYSDSPQASAAHQRTVHVCTGDTAAPLHQWPCFFFGVHTCHQLTNCISAADNICMVGRHASRGRGHLWEQHRQLALATITPRTAVLICPDRRRP